jgi:hypothetical protein
MARDVRAQALVGLIVLGLGAAPAWGADRQQREERPIFTELRGAATAAWNLLQCVWGKNGSSLDPFGAPAPAVQTTTQSTPAASGDSADNGSSLDPFGIH